MARLVDLDEQLSFGELKPAVKFYGKKFYVNKSTEAFFRIKLLDKQLKEDQKNAAKSKKADEKLAELNHNYYKSMLRIVFGEDQAKEIFDMMLTDEQLGYVVQAISAIISDTEFKPNMSEEEIEEKKTSLESADMTSSNNTTGD